MKVDVVSMGSSQKRLEFAIPADHVRAELDRAYGELKGRVRLHGFRKGKAPRKVLEQRFGSRVRADVANNLIQKGWVDALESQNIEPVGRPEVEESGDLKADQDFHFAIKVDVKPELELTHYKGVDVPYEEPEVTDEQVDAAVRARLEEQAKLVEVTDRPVEQGDLALVELVVRDGDDELVREPGTMVRTDGDPYYPGLEEVVLGLSIGEEKTAKVEFGAEARSESVAGQTLDAQVKVLSIQATTVPELSDQVAEELGYEGGAEGLRSAVRMDLQKRRQDTARNEARAALLRVLIDSNPFEVPGGMIDQHLQMLVDELRLQEAYRGRDPRKLQFSEAQIADLRGRAEFAAKGSLILDWVADTEKLEVTDEDLDKRLQELADERGQTVEQIRGYFKDESALEEFRSRLLEEKTLDWLLEQAKLVPPSEPSPEDKGKDQEGEGKGEEGQAESAR